MISSHLGELQHFGGLPGLSPLTERYSKFTKPFSSSWWKTSKNQLIGNLSHIYRVLCIQVILFKFLFTINSPTDCPLQRQLPERMGTTVNTSLGGPKMWQFEIFQKFSYNTVAKQSKPHSHHHRLFGSCFLFSRAHLLPPYQFRKSHWDTSFLVIVGFGFRSLP